MTTLPVQNTTASGNPYTDALLWGGWHWHDAAAPGAPAVISYYLDTYAGRSWSSSESAAIARAFQTWSNVANITFVEVSTAGEAQLIERLASGSRLPGTLGEHGTPDSAANGPEYDGALLLGDANRGYGYFNYEYFASGGFNRGGYDMVTLIHELGHGLGLAHPHDDGGSSGLFPGVTYGNDSDLGSNGLNQGIYTIMSYNDGWASEQNPVGAGLVKYGYSAGPMAFDIAAIQYLYGANSSAHGGDDVYVMPSANVGGTAWLCLWDTGGTDTIAYSGSDNARIDLRAATLDNSSSGGGIPSYAKGIFGGFTIANGVEIENARSAKGNDVLTGNELNNSLSAGSGKDLLRGGGGDDRLAGGAGQDKMFGGAGSDVFVFSASLRDTNVDWVRDFETGVDHIYLSRAIFKHAGPAGDLDADFFARGSAKDRSDHIVYKAGTGDLIYDSNGSAAGGDDVIAHLTRGLALSAADFYVF
jgi:serralysin